MMRMSLQRKAFYILLQYNMTAYTLHTLTVWLIPHMKTLRTGSFDLNTLFF